MKRLIKLFAALFMTLAATPALAELPASKFIEDIKAGGEGAVMPNAILYAMATGWLWANAELESKGQPPLYCTPPRLTVTREQTANILEKFVADRPSAAKHPAGLVLLMAFQYAFPCTG